MAVLENTFRRTIKVLADKMKLPKPKFTLEDRIKETEGVEYYAKMGSLEVGYDPVNRQLTVEGRMYPDIDTKELLPTLMQALSSKSKKASPLRVAHRYLTAISEG